MTKAFYAMVQNKFHYAIVGQTVAEIVYTKADHEKEHMGLTTWKHAPKGRGLRPISTERFRKCWQKIKNKEIAHSEESKICVDQELCKQIARI